MCVCVCVCVCVCLYVCVCVCCRPLRFSMKLNVNNRFDFIFGEINRLTNLNLLICPIDYSL